MKSLIKGLLAAGAIWALALVAVPHSQGIVRSLTTSANYRSPTQKVLFQGVSTGPTQLATTQTTAPTCSASCGTSPSVAGTDTDMVVTMGGTGVPASGFVVTFNGTWAAAPACIGQMALTGMAVGKIPLTVVTSTTTITTVTNAVAPSTSDKYVFHCFGIQ